MLYTRRTDICKLCESSGRSYKNEVLRCCRNEVCKVIRYRVGEVMGLNMRSYRSEVGEVVVIEFAKPTQMRGVQPYRNKVCGIIGHKVCKVIGLIMRSWRSHRNGVCRITEIICRYVCICEVKYAVFCYMDIKVYKVVGFV